jgi:hypothetical protein
MINSTRACILDFGLFLRLYLYTHNTEWFKNINFNMYLQSLTKYIATLCTLSIWEWFYHELGSVFCPLQLLFIGKLMLISIAAGSQGTGMRRARV